MNAYNKLVAHVVTHSFYLIIDVADGGGAHLHKLHIIIIMIF